MHNEEKAHRPAPGLSSLGQGTPTHSGQASARHAKAVGKVAAHARHQRQLQMAGGPIGIRWSSHTTTTERATHETRRSSALPRDHICGRPNPGIWSGAHAAGFPQPPDAGPEGGAPGEELPTDCCGSQEAGTENTRGMCRTGKRRDSNRARSEALSHISHTRRSGLRGGLMGSQFGPDVVPIVRPQIFSGHLATRGALDGHAATNRDRANFLRPLPHKLRMSLDRPSQLGLAPVL